MKTITDDTVDFLPIDCLQKLVFAAIDAQASEDCPDPDHAARHAKNRKITVLGAMNDLADYPEDQRAMLKGFLQYFGGGRK